MQLGAALLMASFVSLVGAHSAASTSTTGATEHHPSGSSRPLHQGTLMGAMLQKVGPKAPAQRRRSEPQARGPISSLVQQSARVRLRSSQVQARKLCSHGLPSKGLGGIATTWTSYWRVAAPDPATTTSFLPARLDEKYRDQIVSPSLGDLAADTHISAFGVPATDMRAYVEELDNLTNWVVRCHSRSEPGTQRMAQ